VKEEMMDNMLRSFACAVLVALLTTGAAVSQERKVTVVSWGGTFQNANREALWKPYTQETGVRIVEDSWNGEVGKIRAMVETGTPTWDLVVADYAHGIVGCEQGFLVPIDPAIIGDRNDYLPGTLHKCSLPLDVFSAILAYNADKIPAAWGANRPTRLEDFWDLQKFPGKRGIRKNPKVTLEQALMADGVPPAQVYDVLSKPGGIERALAKLDKIRPQLVFWGTNAQAPQLLADGEVVLTTIPNGRLETANMEGRHFVPIWDRQIYSNDALIVVKGPNAAEAMKLVAYMTRPEAMARQTKYYTSGPAKKSAMQYVDPAIALKLPTYAKHMENALNRNEAWWADHEAEATEKWNAWLAR
jgi:putative spermidine/putrescine transport system substrate-binding protein